ncbi:MAG TPA: hypothetical protein DIS62_01450 [Candidatus Kerfeldbacteria bacterium]|nr:hypothetical protein [Candidatus Kerfeldbacteria bacterium]
MKWAGYRRFINVIICTMKKPTIVLIIIVAVLIIGGGAYWLGTRSNTNTNVTNQPSSNTGLTVNTAIQNTNATQTDSTYINDDFTVTQPSGWIQVTIPGTLVSFRNVREQHPEGSAAAKISFQSYIAISFDNIQGKTLNDINQTTLDSITSAIGSVNIFAASDETVNDQPAKFSTMEFTQQDVEYTVLLAVYDAGEKYYTMSFNTTTEKWLTYKDKFYEIARSFKLKGQR